MKKTFCTLLPIALLFTGCRFQDNSAKTSMPIGSSDPEPVAQAFDGAEKLQGQDFGVFTMPDVITVPDNFEIYQIQTDETGQVATEECVAEAKRIFSGFLGDNYNENNLQILSSNTQEAIMYFDGNEFLCSLNSSIDLRETFRVHKVFIDRNNEQNNITDLVQLQMEKDRELEFNGSKIKAFEIANNAKNWIDDAAKNTHKDFEFEPKDVFLGRGEDGTDIVTVNFAQYYKGIAFQEYESPYEKQNDDSSYSRYAVAENRVTYVNGLQKPESLYISHIDNFKETEKLDKIISLEGAVNILRNSLANNKKYDFEKVELMYCGMNTQTQIFLDENGNVVDENGEISEELAEQVQQPLTFTPTWCFFFNNEYSGLSREAVKVDAITGEITLDVA